MTRSVITGNLTSISCHSGAQFFYNNLYPALTGQSFLSEHGHCKFIFHNVLQPILSPLLLYIYVHIRSSQMVFLLPLAVHSAKCFLILSYPIIPAIMFLPHKTSVEYTRLYSSIAEVLIYTVEPRIPSNDVFSKCWIVESNPVGAWVLLKLYISPSPIFVIYCSLWTNHSLSPHKICIYHRHPCSTQQLFYKVEIICFSLFFMTQQTFMM